MAADITDFGHSRDGRMVRAIRLTSPDLTATVLTWGAALQDLRLAGVAHSLTLGSDRIGAYEGPMGYYGTLVGPVANRIGGARAVVAGREHRFPANEGPNLLHGGKTGIQARHWAVDAADAASVTLRLVLEDGDDGFPGRREITATYAVEGPSLTLTLTGTSDAPTLMNLAHHGYWNLDGAPTMAGHTLRVPADHYLPTDEALIPTGEIRPVSGVHDLRLGRVLDLTEGFDTNFCLADARRDLTEVAELTGPSGITMTLSSTEPGLQIYDGRGVDTAPFAGHAGRPYTAYEGIALEPQLWPDAPNHPNFPSVALDPAQTYRQVTRWSFAKA